MDSVKPVSVDFSEASEADLVQYQLHANDWYVRQARRILQERGLTKDGTAALEKIVFENKDDTRQLRALWALHCGGTLSEATALNATKAQSEYVRGWAVTLLCESGKPSDAVLAQMLRLAKSDPSPHVRLRKASSSSACPSCSAGPC